MESARRAADDQNRAAGHQALLSAADGFSEDFDQVERIRHIARDICILTDLERSAFRAISGDDCCGDQAVAE